MAKSQKYVKSSAPPKTLQITLIVAIVAGLLFVKPYIGAILFSGLIAYIFNPVYKSILRKTKRQSVALFGTLVAATLSVVIPLVFIVTVTISQVNSLINKYNTSSVTNGPANVQDVVDRGVERVNKILTAFPGGEKLNIDKQKITDGLKNALTEGLKFLANTLKDVGTAFFGLISTSILAVFLIISMLRYQDELIRLLKNISPLDDRLNNLYLKRAGLMTKGMVKGQFIIASAQGLASAFSLWVVGLDYFWFFLLLLSFLSFIPLGAGIVTIPIGVVLIFSGHFLQGAFVILWHMFVVGFIDNILRPRLVHKDAHLNTAVMMLAVFSGIAVFGAPGVIYGPVVMILIITTIYIYAEYTSSTSRTELESENNS